MIGRRCKARERLSRAPLIGRALRDRLKAPSAPDRSQDHPFLKRCAAPRAPATPKGPPGPFRVYGVGFGRLRPFTATGDRGCVCHGWAGRSLFVPDCFQRLEAGNSLGFRPKVHATFVFLELVCELAVGEHRLRVIHVHFRLKCAVPDIDGISFGSAIFRLVVFPALGNIALQRQVKTSRVEVSFVYRSVHSLRSLFMLRIFN